MQNKENHALVIGAGISGLATAYHLNQAGIAVTIFDQTDGANNCSVGNAGLIAPRYIIPLASPGVITQGLGWMLKKESPFYIQPRLNKDLIRWLWKFKKAATTEHVNAAGPVLRDMIRRNQELLIALEENDKLDFNFHKTGHLSLYETEAGGEKELKAAERAKELGIPVHVLTAKEVFDMEPLATKNTIGATYYPEDAHLYSNKLMRGLRSLLEERGVVFKNHTEIAAISESSTGTIQVKSTKKETFSGNYLIICGGAWTSDLMKNLHVNIPIQAGKGYSISLKNPPSISRYSFTMAEKKVAITPMDKSMRFAGTMEIVGKDMSITKPKVNAIKKAILEFYPQYNLEGLSREEVWVGLRPCSADGMPYVGKVDSYKNIFISSGYSMVGMSMSFAAGEIIKQLITTGKADLASPMTDPNRFN